ncbi:MAG: IS1595 family transposase [Candidatus Binatia bacterium]
MKMNELLATFDTEESCKAYLVEKRWPNGEIECPKCGNQKVYTLKTRPFHWVCKKCNKNGYRFSVLSGTIFENTKYPLRDWFKVLFLMYSSKKGMSAHQIHRMLGTGCYETAWYMCHRIRAAMQSEDFFQLMGEVEVDETYVGGKAKNRHGGRSGNGRGTANKVAVVGAIARKGNIVAQVVEHVDQKTLNSFVQETVSDKVSLVATDEHSGYANLRKKGFPHQTVNHSEGEYVHGNVHTQNIDGFWSLLKRGIIGNYHKVSKEYLPLYVAEFAFRHNHREDTDIFGSIIAGC